MFKQTEKRDFVAKFYIFSFQINFKMSDEEIVQDSEDEEEKKPVTHIKSYTDIQKMKLDK